MPQQRVSSTGSVLSLPRLSLVYTSFQHFTPSTCHISSLLFPLASSFPLIFSTLSHDVTGVQPMLRALNTACFPASHRSPSFELFGLDVLVDQDLRPYLLEVNQSPSLAIDTPVDKAVKSLLLKETFKLLGLCSPSTPPSCFWRVYPNKEQAQRYDKLFCFPFPQELLQLSSEYSHHHSQTSTSSTSTQPSSEHLLSAEDIRNVLLAIQEQ